MRLASSTLNPLVKAEEGRINIKLQVRFAIVIEGALGDE
jgi:hypothetical protein